MSTADTQTETTTPDVLTIEGLSRYLDGTYEFDMRGLVMVGHAESMTNRELRRVKLMSGVRAGELEEALQAGDNDVLVAISAIILTRAGKRFEDDILWDAPAGSRIQWKIGGVDPAEEDEDETPLSDAPEKSSPRRSSESSRSSGTSSGRSSESRESDPSPIGARPSDSSE